MDEDTGELKTKVTLDYEKIKAIPFTLMAKTTKNVVTKNGTVFVVDENDNHPEFIGETNFMVDLSELAIGTAIGKIKAIDADSAENGDLFYTSRSEFLLIDNKTGVIWLDPRFVNVEENQWQVTVQANDRGAPSLFSNITVVIDVIPKPAHLFAPSFDQMFLPKSVNSITLSNISFPRLRFYETANISSFADFLSNGQIYFIPKNHQLFYKIPYQVDDYKRKAHYTQELTVYPEVSVLSEI